MTFELASPDARTALVKIRGELDLGNVEQLAAAVDPMLEGDLQRLVLELSGLRFADSSAIALWVQWSMKVPELELREPAPLLRRVLTTMGLAGRLKVTP